MTARAQREPLVEAMNIYEAHPGSWRRRKNEEFPELSTIGAGIGAVSCRHGLYATWS